MRVISRGSGPSHGHTDGPFDCVSKPGVASVSPKAWGRCTNPEGLGSISGGLTKSRAAGGELHLIFWRVLGSWVFGLFLLERFPSLLIDSGSTPPFGKEWKNLSKGNRQKWTHGIERQPQGKDVESVAICAKKRLRRFFLQRPPQTPAIHHPITCAAPQRIIDSLAVHAVH